MSNVYCIAGGAGGGEGWSGVPLSEYISHYTPLTYDTSNVHHQHTRHIRDTSLSPLHHTQPVSITIALFLSNITNI